MLNCVEEEDFNMSLEIVRDTITLKKRVLNESLQTIAVNDLIVPDINPDIKRILVCDGSVFVNNISIDDDMVNLNGDIEYRIIYVSEGEKEQINSASIRTGFSQEINLQSAKPEHEIKVNSLIEHTECSIINGRKINVKSIIEVQLKAMENKNLKIIKDLENEENLQILRGKTVINCFAGSCEETLELDEKIEIPSGKPNLREIIRKDLKITDKEYKIAGNKIIVQGSLNILTLYTDEEMTGIHYLENEIPFLKTLEIRDIDEDSYCDVNVKIRESNISIDEDNDGETRVLSVEAEILIESEAFEKREVEYIEDAYSLNRNIKPDREVINMEELISNEQSQIVIKDVVKLKEDKPVISEIFNVLNEPVIVESRIDDNKIIVEGIVNSNILYLSEDSRQLITSDKQEIPFNYKFEISGLQSNNNYDVDLFMEHSSYSIINQKEIEVRMIIGVEAKVSREFEISLVTGLENDTDDDFQNTYLPYITVYFVQPGDTAWGIAKKYNTTIEEIKENNEISGNDVYPGQQIIVTKKIC